jgi:flagellar basal-body rod protein FlgG
MQSAVYNAVFGGTTQAVRMDMIANNLANANTTGYKKDKMSFVNVFQEHASDLCDPNRTLNGELPWPERVNVSQTRVGTVKIDYSQGAMKQTGNPLDLAIEGEGLFKVSTPNGMMYTRSGVFHLNTDGTIVDQHNNALQGQNGSLQISGASSLIVDEQGRVLVDGNPVDRLGFVTFDDPQKLERIGQHMFRNPTDDPAEEKPVENGTVCQGFLEASNVQVVEEMVRMIEVSRAYNLDQKVMTTSADMDKKVTDSVGKGSV